MHRDGIAEYLSQFTRSPYVLPAHERQTVEGVSTLTGSWRPNIGTEETGIGDGGTAG